MIHSVSTLSVNIEVMINTFTNAICLIRHPRCTAML